MAVRESTQAEDYAPEPAVQRDRGRSEDQQDVDKRTEALVTQWDEAGQPGMVDGSYAGPVVRFDVDDKAEGKRMVGRAFTQINKARKTHTDEAGKLAPLVPTALRAYWYKDSQPKDGWVTIQFGVIPVPDASNGETPPSQGQEDQASGQESQEDQGQEDQGQEDQGQEDQAQEGQPRRGGRFSRQ